MPDSRQDIIWTNNDLVYGRVYEVKFVSSGGHFLSWRRVYNPVYIDMRRRYVVALLWRHNGHNSVSNHQPYDCLLRRLFRCRSKQTSKLRVTGLCAGNSPGPVNFPHKWPVTRKMFPFDDVIMDVKYNRSNWVVAYIKSKLSTQSRRWECHVISKADFMLFASNCIALSWSLVDLGKNFHWTLFRRS